MSVAQWFLLATVLFVATAAAIGCIAAMWRRRSPGLARHVANGLGLNRREQRDLASLASHAGLDQPTAMLISRGCFDRVLDRVPVEERPDSVQGLRERLFGS